MASKTVKNMKLASLDDLFSTEEQRQEAKAERVWDIPLSEIDAFPEHPFHVSEGDEMTAMVESIRKYGVLTPAIARKKEDGRYELVSGHRRKLACELAGLEALPVIVKQMSRDEAVIFMVDANLQREHILPSEKAFAYKMKMEALAHQGKRTDLTSCQLGTKLNSAEITAEKSGESERQVFRYIRLTNLIPGLLQMVDAKKIAFNPAVELSYLSVGEQRTLLELMELYDCTPSHAQAIRLKRLSQDGALNEMLITEVISAEKPNQREQVRYPIERISKCLPKNATAKEAQAFIEKAVAHYIKVLERKRTEQER